MAQRRIVHPAEAAVSGPRLVLRSRTHDGRALKLLTVLDEHTRECLAIVVARKIRSHDVLEVLADLFVRHGPPAYLMDNGPEQPVGERLGKLRDELLNGEIFYSLAQAAVLVEQWRREYNTVRPHSACGGFPPAPEAIKPSLVPEDARPSRPSTGAGTNIGCGTAQVTGAGYLTWGVDEGEVRKSKLYDRMSWVALALLILGYGLQIASNWM